MAELDIAGLGIWSEEFSNWSEFCAGLKTGNWQTASVLKSNLIAPKERRRAPQLVKIAVEVMSQACEHASIDPSRVATVFSSAMGDMQITDYMCGILGTTPRAVSPTKFHNSVHNAPIGYWSIATQSYGPANAVSAYTYTAPNAFLEAAIQVTEEDTPVLLVTQEMAAPDQFREICPSMQAFSSALLLTPANYCSSAVTSVQFSVSRKTVDWPELPSDLKGSLGSNFAAKLLPLLADIAKAKHSVSHQFPLTKNLCLSLSLPQ